MYRNVLVAIDGGDGGRDAAALAGVLVPRAERLTYVNARQRDWPGMRGAATDGSTGEKEYSLELIAKVKQEFAPDADELSREATSVAAGIKATAEMVGADLIVLGSCHRSVAGRVLSGNDALSTLHGAPCAVVLAPRGYADNRPVRISRIGVAYDGSAQSKPALVAARSLAKGHRAAVAARDVAHFTIYGYGWVAPYVENAEIVREAERNRIGAVDDVELSVVVGLVTDEMEKFSDEVDVLLCGSRRRGPVKRTLLGSTSDYLAGHARCPLLVVPAVAETSPDIAAGELTHTVA